MKHIVFVLTFIFILKTFADDKKCKKYEKEGYDIEIHTTCPDALLTDIHKYFQECFKGINKTMKYDKNSTFSNHSMYWAGQRMLKLNYGEHRFAQLGMGAWRETEIYTRFFNFTPALVGKTVQQFPQYAAPPYTEFTEQEWKDTIEMGIGCWAQETNKTIAKNKSVRGISVWVWLYFDLPDSFKNRIKYNGTTIAPTTTPTTAIPSTTAKTTSKTF